MMRTAKLPDRPARFPAHDHCTVAREDGTLALGILLNLSEKGFSVECRHVFDVGERVELRVSGVGCFSGIIRWTDSIQAGGVLHPFANGAFDGSVASAPKDQA